MASFKLVFSVLVCVAIAAPMTLKADEYCNQVSAALAPCLTFLTNGGNPSDVCCNAVKSVKNKAVSTAALQKTCECLKEDFNRIPAIKPENAAALPDDCNVKLPFNVSVNTDCNKVN